MVSVYTFACKKTICKKIKEVRVINNGIKPNYSLFSKKPLVNKVYILLYKKVGFYTSCLGEIISVHRECMAVF